MTDEHAVYGVPLLEPPCKASKLKTSKDDTDHGSDENYASEAQFLQYKTKPGNFYYGLSIQTGKQLLAGTPDAGVYVVLVGSGGHTGKVYLQSAISKAMSKKYIGRGACDNVVLNSKADHDLGEVMVVVLGIDKNRRHSILPDPWFVDGVAVFNFQTKKPMTIFPCYHWIGNGDSVSFTAHTTTLLSIGNNKILRTQREIQLKKRKKEYIWKPSGIEGLPAHIDDTVLTLPFDERFDTTKLLDFTGTAMKDGGRIVFQLTFQGIDNLHDYEKMATTLCRAEVPVHEASRWITDVEFGRQMLNGVNPVVIKKCTLLPFNFPVTNDMVKGFLNRGWTLEQEMAAGHIYICDLKILKDIPTREGRFCTAPMCLLYVNGNNELVPIAIQLKQEFGDDNPIFLPSDHWIDWLLAKIFYQSAHGQVHQLSTHYFSCHAMMEAYSMITNRNLPDPHPIYKLLRPHFRYTMAINTAARVSLINNGGIIDNLFSIGGEGKRELIKRVSREYSVHWTNIECSVQQRGVDNKEELFPYYYRDDGLKVWKAMKEFATEIIDEFYKTDKDVIDDEELQSWSQDFYKNAFPSADDGCGFPEKITTKKMLAEYCTLIMFTGSAQHASINFGQYNIYGFAPNSPASLRHPPPSVKKQADYATLLNTLPDMGDTSLQIAVVHLLSRYSQDEIYLGNYPAKRFTEEGPQQKITGFEKRLTEIVDEIESRNSDLDVPYTYMLPTKIPNSITI